MPNIMYSPTAQLVQVEDFPADCERTVKGALYVRPGRTAVVSDGEVAHLQRRGIPFSVIGPKVPLAAPAVPVSRAGAQPSKVMTLPGQDGPVKASTDAEK